jgi:hypothetical protein
MDFTSELLARLQKGESVDSLAAELTKAINDAHTENERIKAEAEAKRKAEAEAKRQAEMKAQDKYDAIESLLCAIEKVIVAWDLGDDILDAVDEIDADELVKELDEAIPAAKAYAEMLEKIGALREARPVADTVPDKQRQGDPIEDFLNKFVR